ncbi:MAG: class I SAM-dependent methyltransferase [Planctomycetes bacterium]|nr:class I SAM-dependent methyltransferase [Planctomycetota bacterium]
MTAAALLKKDVRTANRRLYDAIGSRYENIDGRRDESLFRWIRKTLTQLSHRHGNGDLLDLGTGSGVVIRAAGDLFENCIALDLSPSMLASIRVNGAHRIAADVDHLPFRDESMDVITCFAVLHHLVDSERLAREVARVLRPGGVFWSDHDIELKFCRRFRGPLSLYRRLRGADRHYMDGQSRLDRKTYDLAECRESGVDSSQTFDDFKRANLDTTACFHWFGLTPLTNRLFSNRMFPKGWAPLLRMIAVKPPR